MNVATAQATQLSTEQSALNVRQQQLLDTVSLIGDVGGGWSADALDDAAKSDAAKSAAAR